MGAMGSSDDRLCQRVPRSLEYKGYWVGGSSGRNGGDVCTAWLRRYAHLRSNRNCTLVSRILARARSPERFLGALDLHEWLDDHALLPIDVVVLVRESPHILKVKKQIQEVAVLR